MKKIQDEIYDYFDNQPIPELDEKTENKFKELVARNKPKSKAKFWKKFAIISSVSVCCLLCLIIPLVILLSNPQPTTRFYTDDEAMKTQMTETEFNSFIQDNFPQYNFLIDDFEFQSAIAFYEPDTTNLLAVRVMADEMMQPFTYIDICIVISNNFNLSDQNAYTDDSIYEKTANYELFKKTNSDIYFERMMAYVVFSNYSIYINFDCVNDSLLEQFL